MAFADKTLCTAINEINSQAWDSTALRNINMCVLSRNPVDLKSRKSTGTSCQIEICFSIQIIKFLMKYNLLCLVDL